MSTGGQFAVSPDWLQPTFTDMRLGIARTIPKMDGQEPVHEIEAAWVEMIGQAKRMIYAESQYFASRRIPMPSPNGWQARTRPRSSS